MFILGNADKNLLVDRPRENKYYDETIKISINDQNNTHAIIASSVKEKSICLDVGCGAGYTGNLLKSEKDCKVYGIEIDKEAIQTAEKHGWYEEIFDFSIIDQQNKKYKDFFNNSLKFDYILFADVLEHIPNPGEVIYHFSKKLKPNGKILTSIPNVAHFDISQNLINRTFNYNHVGLLDNTHLRFFTKNSFYDMIEKINEVYQTTLYAEEIGKTIIPSPDIDRYPHLRKILDQDKELCVLQYVYKIEISNKQKQKKCLKKVDYFEMIEKQLEQRKEYLEKNEKLKEENYLLKKQCSDLEGALKENQKKYERIIESSSWKITRPFRKMMDFIRSVKRHFQK